MDRLVISDVKDLNLQFTAGNKCSSTFRLTNLMHTMSVAVSLTTTNPSIFSFTQSFSIIPPLSTQSFTLILSKPSDHPPLSSPPDTVHVRSTMLPTGKASQEELRRLFSKPGPHIFKDVTISVSLVGSDVIETLILTTGTKTLETAFVLSKAISWCDEPELSLLLRPAAGAGNAYVVSSLIDAGADVNYRSRSRSTDGEFGESVISLAIRSGNIETVRVLVESSYVIDHENDRFLHDAASVNRADMIKVLCMNYSDLDLNSINSEGQTPIHIAANHNNLEAIEFLISSGSDPDIADHNGWTALHYASINGHVEAVNLLLHSINYTKQAVTKQGKTAFDLAVENGHKELYSTLHLGDLLHHAARKGDADLMRKCLSQGAMVNEPDQNGWTALHRAAFKGHVEGVRVLLDHGGSVDRVDRSGYTALHRAVEAGHGPVAMMLIACGAKASMKSLAVRFDFDPVKKHESQKHNPLQCRIQRG